MASAFASSIKDDDEDCVVSKRNFSKKQLDDIRQKAFVPAQLPKDFLRVVLNKQQIDEKNDNELAKRMQFGSIEPQYGYPYDEFNHELTPARAKAMAASLGRGRLQIDLLEARLTKNYGLVKMDPYVRMRLGTKVFETHTDNGGGKNPRWQKTVMCYLPHNVDTLIVEIYDEKSITNDELIAFVKFPLPETLFQGKFINEWIPLSGKLGEQKEGHINIQLLFIPIDQLNLDPYAQIYGRQNVRPYSSIPSPTHVQLPPTRQNSAINQMPSETNIQRIEQFTEKDINNIKEMFPAFDVEVIKSLMESNGGNKERTIESLLQMIAD